MQSLADTSETAAGVPANVAWANRLERDVERLEVMAKRASELGAPILKTACAQVVEELLALKFEADVRPGAATCASTPTSWRVDRNFSVRDQFGLGNSELRVWMRVHRRLSGTCQVTVGLTGYVDSVARLADRSFAEETILWHSALTVPGTPMAEATLFEGVANLLDANKQESTRELIRQFCTQLLDWVSP